MKSLTSIPFGGPIVHCMSRAINAMQDVQVTPNQWPVHSMQGSRYLRDIPFSQRVLENADMQSAQLMLSLIWIFPGTLI